ncbi:ELM1/GtrOC1 family putative glycosyltransferase [Candidatus Omnitrophota bacterium]
MKKDYVIDYLLLATFKALSLFCRALPMSIAIECGKVFGLLFYCFDTKHRHRAYANVRLAFCKTKTLRELRQITKTTFINFGISFVELLRLPLITQEYTEKYITIEGKEYIDEAMQQGKGLILLSFHMGSWEVANIVTKNLGYPYKVIASEQSRYPKLDKFLNSYRRIGKDIVIFKKISTKQIVRSLNSNEIATLTIDQGGKAGNLITFFNKTASMQTGWIRLALRFDVPVVVGYIIRERGPYQRLIFTGFTVENNGSAEHDKKKNLERITSNFERIISRHPQHYLWFFKLWKYSDERFAVILSDSKTGHMRQSESVMKALQQEVLRRNLKLTTNVVNVKFRNKLSQCMATLIACVVFKRFPQVGIGWLRPFLEKKTYKELLTVNCDYVISCGSSVAPINVFLANETLARSIAVLRPSIISFHKFDMVVLPQHDNPPQRKNVIATEGSLNVIDDTYLEQQSQLLISRFPTLQTNRKTRVGLLIGGDTKNNRMSQRVIDNLVARVRTISKELDFEMLVTTSRRTSKEIDDVVKKTLQSFAQCKLLVIANEKNVAEAVGGILGLSQIVFVSSDSISMISEAINSGKHVIVFNASGDGHISLNKRHRAFLELLRRKNYITWLEDVHAVETVVKDIHQTRPTVKTSKDFDTIREAIKKII